MSPLDMLIMFFFILVACKAGKMCYDDLFNSEDE